MEEIIITTTPILLEIMGEVITGVIRQRLQEHTVEVQAGVIVVRTVEEIQVEDRMEEDHMEEDHMEEGTIRMAVEVQVEDRMVAHQEVVLMVEVADRMVVHQEVAEDHIVVEDDNKYFQKKSSKIFLT